MSPDEVEKEKEVGSLTIKGFAMQAYCQPVNILPAISGYPKTTKSLKPNTY